MKRAKQIVTMAIIAALASCASMAPASTEDRVDTYNADPAAVEAAIRDYLFDSGLRIVSHGNGYLNAERAETGVAAGVLVGGQGGMTHKMDFQWRESPGGTELRAFIYAELGNGRRYEAERVLYEQFFNTIRSKL